MPRETTPRAPAIAAVSKRVHVEIARARPTATLDIFYPYAPPQLFPSYFFLLTFFFFHCFWLGSAMAEITKGDETMQKSPKLNAKLARNEYNPFRSSVAQVSDPVVRKRLDLTSSTN